MSAIDNVKDLLQGISSNDNYINWMMSTKLFIILFSQFLYVPEIFCLKLLSNKEIF